jgi:hypothetical protein
MIEEWKWYHIVLTTYGSWLYGDSRGFRTRHHREHVEGDYKNPPPPGEYEDLEHRSRGSLKQDQVVLSPEWRQIAGKALVERWQKLGALLVCVAVGGQHVHLLAKMPRTESRRWAGFSKRHAWFVARVQGWQGKMWGKRSKAVPIRNREHQLKVFRYILAHAEEGAWVWSMLDNR